MIVATPVHGLQALGVFRELLALDAEQRGNQDAALTVLLLRVRAERRKKKPIPYGTGLKKALIFPRGNTIRT